MEDEQERYLERARELLQEFERPNAYAVLDVTRATPASELHSAFARAATNRSRTGRSMADLARAREYLKDVRKRLELDAHSLDRDEWLRALEAIRNYYALFDFLGDLR